jgi:sulfonate transport system ATP-binding protein
MNAAPVLALEGVAHRYPGAAAATLAGVDLALAAGEIVAVVGASGCGKTTLVRLLAGLERAQAGRILLDGAALHGPHPRIGVVFQEPRLLPWLSVADNVGFGLHGLPRAERDRRVRAALTRVQLGALAGRWPHELSGGQAQRVAIARALAVEPELILMDEPFSALDPATRRALQDEVATLWTGSKGALLLVTHDPDEALVLADRVVVLAAHPGRIATTLSIDLPRPRCRDGAAFAALRAEFLAALAHAGELS